MSEGTAQPQVVSVADMHIGSQFGLCPPEGMPLDGGGQVLPSEPQLKLWAYWEHFWGTWVPRATRGEPFALELNGDVIEGVHHGTTELMSSNKTDQRNLAHTILAPIIEKPEVTEVYFVRGTEAHVGPAAEDEEAVAQYLKEKCGKVIYDELGKASRADLWLEIGRGLCHFAHHIGTTSSPHYESTAPTKEMSLGFEEAGQWRLQPADVYIRSHRHRYVEVRKPSIHGYTIVVTTPGWQLKTGYCSRIAGARLSPVQLGGVLVRYGDEELYTRAWVQTIGRPRTERIGGHRSTTT